MAAQVRCSVWISWNDSRRSRNLASTLGVPLVVEDHEGTILVRHARGAIVTIWNLMRARPDTVYLQYSFLLLLVLTCYRMVRQSRVRIVCDCHNKALKRAVSGLLGIPFSLVKRWTLEQADELWVATPSFVQFAEQFGRPVRVVPDPPPEFPCTGAVTDEDLVVVVSSFAEDEPLGEVLDAAQRLQNLRFFITGRAPEYARETTRPANVTLTGFMPEEQYVHLLQRAAVIAAITVDRTIVQCAGHEALAAGRPLVMTDSVPARHAFSDAAIYVEPRADEIAVGIRAALGSPALVESSKRVYAARRNAFAELATLLAAEPH